MAEKEKGIKEYSWISKTIFKQRCRELSRRLYVGDLPRNTKNDEFHTYFSKFGEIDSIFIPKHKDTKYSRSFGYVTFVDGIAYQEVLKKKNHMIRGRRLFIEIAKSFKQRKIEKYRKESYDSEERYQRHRYRKSSAENSDDDDYRRHSRRSGKDSYDNYRRHRRRSGKHSYDDYRRDGRRSGKHSYDDYRRDGRRSGKDSDDDYRRDGRRGGKDSSNNQLHGSIYPFSYEEQNQVQYQLQQPQQLLQQLSQQQQLQQNQQQQQQPQMQQQPYFHNNDLNTNHYERRTITNERVSNPVYNLQNILNQKERQRQYINQLQLFIDGQKQVARQYDDYLTQANINKQYKINVRKLRSSDNNPY